MGKVRPLAPNPETMVRVTGGTRPHCKQAAALFTWPNYPGSIGYIALRKGLGSGEPAVNSGFIGQRRDTQSAKRPEAKQWPTGLAGFKCKKQTEIAEMYDELQQGR